MNKVIPVIRNGSIIGYRFHCEGCGNSHIYYTSWNFNGDLINPTFTPSLLNRIPATESTPEHRCHLYVENGKIKYLNDCTHKLAGQTIEMDLTDETDNLIE